MGRQEAQVLLEETEKKITLNLLEMFEERMCSFTRTSLTSFSFCQKSVGIFLTVS